MEMVKKKKNNPYPAGKFKDLKTEDTHTVGAQ